MSRARPAKINLNTISEEDLLQAKICDLPVRLSGTWVEDCLEQLYKELQRKSMAFRPVGYLADEWLTPEQETCLGIPFYLTHPRLIELEKKFMGEAEGEGTSWCMKLLRHETGHTIYYAYRLYRRRRWQKIFGSPYVEYADTYKARPYSRNYVQHLDGHYAQYHPEEDFAETFAVWLDPHSNWRERYAGWKALEKLEYVDELMQEIKDKRIQNTSKEKFYRLATLRFTLRTYYKKKRQDLAEEFSDFHDPFLRRHFKEAKAMVRPAYPTRDIIQKYHKTILETVSRNTGEPKHAIHRLIKGIEQRSRELDLVTSEQESEVALNLSSYITSLTKNYQYTGRYRGDRKFKS